MNVWMSRTRAFLSRRTPLAAVVVFCIVAFMLILAFGSPPHGLGLDPSWTEVLAWGFLHHAQWGRDLLFTYGPLGFLQPYASYVQGIFPYYVAGEIALPAAFALTVGLMLRRSTLGVFALFVLVYVCWSSRLGGDVSWAFTLLFGTAFLADEASRRSASVFYVAATALAAIFGAVALTKFSLFPLWVLCLATTVIACLIEGERRRAAFCLFIFPAMLAAAWMAAGQQLQILPLFLARSLEVATGYGHAMGNPAPFVVEVGALGLLGAYLLACVYAAWNKRTDKPALATLCLSAAALALVWLAFLTRGDHWPWFFTAIAFLPFPLLIDARLADQLLLRRVLFLIVLAGIAAAAVIVSPRTISLELVARVRNSIHNLANLAELGAIRDAEWKQLEKDAVLPKIRERVGKERIDVLTWEQGMLLINGLNYAPRPVFQSYSAYTPKLARLNESYFLGNDAPAYVMLKLDAADDRVPMSEDALALIALLRHYRPVLFEKRFLLLQHDKSVAAGELLSAQGAEARTTLGAEVQVPKSASPTLAFIDAELNAFGKIYTLFFREPALQVTLTLANGDKPRFRLVRRTAAVGFVMSPLVKSAGDWVKLYFGKSLPDVTSFRVDAESPWYRWVFQQELGVRLQNTDVLRADGAVVPPELGSTLLYPGFNLAPSAPEDIRVVTEAEQDAVYIHAPGALSFQPQPGRYTVSAVYGIQAIAINDPGCIKLGADGIGVSLVLRRGGKETLLMHGELNPFRVPRDRGPQRFGVDSIDIVAGDILDYRVDPGHRGSNVSCDWSFVRDFVFTRRGDLAQGVNEATFAGFNIQPGSKSLRIVLEDEKEAVFLHAPAALTFRPPPGRYRISAAFGVQSIAWQDPGCASANADGVGVSLVLHHGDTESTLWHGEVDPFHVAKDKAGGRLNVGPLDIAAGDVVDYRVDPGHNGSSISCDWSYLRELQFALATPATAPAKRKPAGAKP